MEFSNKSLQMMMARQWPASFRYSFAIGSILLATLIRWWADPVMPPGFPFLTYFPAVILTAFLAGLGPGIVAGALSLLAAWYFFIAPLNSFTLDGPSALALGFFLLVVIIDIVIIHLMNQALAQVGRERERARKAEAAALDHARHRDLLFTELQHRVSNNLQIVSALLSLQKADITDAKARSALNEAAERLALIGRIHRRLVSPDSSQDDLGPFLFDLAGDLVKAAGADHVLCRVEALPVSLPNDKLAPVALIVAELVSNAVEHGFPGRSIGHIDIALYPVEGNRLCITITDDGVGLPAGFDSAAAPSMGLRLVRLLTQQINGQFDMRSEGGTQARLIFAP